MALLYRCFLAKDKEIIPLLGAYGLANQLGVDPNMHDPGGFVKSSTPGWIPYACSGQSVRPEISPDGASLIVDHGCAVLAEERLRA